MFHFVVRADELLLTLSGVVDGPHIPFLGAVDGCLLTFRSVEVVAYVL